MSCFTEYTAADYLDCKESISEKIKAIDTMITALFSLMASTIGGAAGNISSYELDDGQVRIKTTYRNVQDISGDMASLRVMRNLYVSQLRGRATVLQDKRTFR